MNEKILSFWTWIQDPDPHWRKMYDRDLDAQNVHADLKLCRKPFESSDAFSGGIF